MGISIAPGDDEIILPMPGSNICILGPQRKCTVLLLRLLRSSISIEEEFLNLNHMADSCGNTNSVNFRAALFICSFLIQYLQFYRFKRGVNKVELE